jgi:cytochrome c
LSGFGVRNPNRSEAGISTLLIKEAPMFKSMAWTSRPAASARGFPDLDLATGPALAAAQPPRQFRDGEAVGAEFDQAMRKQDRFMPAPLADHNQGDAACRQVGDNAKNAVGPVLNGLFGRKAGTVANYSYSPANKNSGLTWDEATFSKYIKDPKGVVPGTKMIYAGLKDETKIKDLIAFLKQYDESGKKTP